MIFYRVYASYDCEFFDEKNWIDNFDSDLKRVLKKIDYLLYDQEKYFVFSSAFVRSFFYMLFFLIIFVIYSLTRLFHVHHFLSLLSLVMSLISRLFTTFVAVSYAAQRIETFSIMQKKLFIAYLSTFLFESQYFLFCA